MRRLPVLAASIILAANMNAENPFDFKTTPGKLPKEIVPTDYSIRIVPNTDTLTFDGSETVNLEARSAVRMLVLNAADMTITAATIKRDHLG